MMRMKKAICIGGRAFRDFTGGANTRKQAGYLLCRIGYCTLLQLLRGL